MVEKQIFLNKKIKNIEIKMLRKNEECYIKIIPTTHKSNPKKLYIIINGEEHHFDIYDQNGRESHKIYLKGNQIKPCFYLIDDKNYFKILCNLNEIVVTKNSKEFNKMHNCISKKISCWGVDIYTTSRKEKLPFCEMH